MDAGYAIKEASLNSQKCLTYFQFCNPCLSSPSLTILFLSRYITIYFFYVSIELPFSGFLQFLSMWPKYLEIPTLRPVKESSTLIQ